MFKKKSTISKLWLKLTDKPAYIKYKLDCEVHKFDEAYKGFLTPDELNTYPKIKQFCAVNSQLNVKHSGNAGDIIYALPVLKKIHKDTGVNINLLLKTGRPLTIASHMSHPLGNVMLNQKMIDMLLPLLKDQLYINKCETFAGQKVDIDLDLFRSKVLPLESGNIARWCSYITGVTPILYKSWLDVNGDTTYRDTIVIARSERYRNKYINYGFLNQYKKLAFVGVESEFKDIKKQIPHIEWVQVKDFLTLAKIIAGCKFFIGNQSFPFSLAESLKVPRILEMYYFAPNVVLEGENGYDFYFQEHFEALVNELNSVN
jgi:hypothetical protein